MTFHMACCCEEPVGCPTDCSGCATSRTITQGRIQVVDGFNTCIVNLAGIVVSRPYSNCIAGLASCTWGSDASLSCEGGPVIAGWKVAVYCGGDVGQPEEFLWGIGFTGNAFFTLAYRCYSSTVSSSCPPAGTYGSFCEKRACGVTASAPTYTILTPIILA